MRPNIWLIINYEDYKNRSEYRTLVSAATSRDYDEAVKLFLMEYPDSTVVYAGCSLDTMFERVDNGRVMWYNLDSPGRIAVRNMYTTDSCDREKIIDRSVNDLTWIDETARSTRACFSFSEISCPTTGRMRLGIS